jgi:hypothetical protein
MRLTLWLAPLVWSTLLCAQAGSPVAGLVVNRATGRGVAAASVTFFNQHSVRYQAVTDASGAFLLEHVDQGEYQALVEKSGFVLFAKDRLLVRSGEPSAIRLRFEMQFGRSQQASLRGRVLDSQNQPAASVQVDLIRGPALRFSTVTAADGRFAFDQLDPGAYKLRAVPNNKPAARSSDVATYFPSSIDEAGAQRITVRGDAEIDGFRLKSAPVFLLRGVAMDRETGRPASRANVTLLPIREQPAHVIYSFDSSFFVIGEGQAPGPEEARTITAEDGSFAFSVRAGVWRIAAQAAPAIDSRTGFNYAGSGVTEVIVRAADVADAQVWLGSPFSLAGSARWTVFCVSGRLACGTGAANSGVAPVWLHAVDGQPSGLHLGAIQPDGAFNIEGVRPGAYMIQPLPAFLEGHIVPGARPSWLLASRQIARPVDLIRGAGPLNLSYSVQIAEGGPVLLDTDHPVDLSARNLDTAFYASVQGMVENGFGAAVVFYADGRGTLGFCQPDGSFVSELVSGTYSVAAFPGLDLEGLRDPALLPFIQSAGVKVRVEAGTTTELNLKLSPWPE